MLSVLLTSAVAVVADAVYAVVAYVTCIVVVGTGAEKCCCCSCVSR